MDDDKTVVEVPMPADEDERLALLASCQLDATPEEAFQELTRLAARLCGTPAAYVSLIDHDRQWFKARVGMELTEVPRSVSPCNYTIQSAGPIVVPDTLRDERFASVGGPPYVRFYAGLPLRISPGSAIGTLCVIDFEPRDLDTAQLTALQGIARQISRELALRSELLRARRASGEAAPPAPGEVVGSQWEIVRPIGQGGLGAVFEARGPDGARAAIKCLLAQWAARDEMVERFAREARVLAALRSPHVARILDVGNLDAKHCEAPFIAMEYLEGEDLRCRTARDGRADWRDATRWIAQACEGLAEAHASGIVHRDVKPANLFLERGGDVKVIDFGIAKIATALDPLTKTGTLLGSLRYMSPEQLIAGDSIDPRGDVWSLGVVLYELLTASRLFRGESELQVAAAILNAEVPRVGALVPVPEHVEALVARCLQRDRAQRFRDAAELAAALAAS